MPVQYDNKRVIKPNLEHSWTPEMVGEYAKCYKSVRYFILNHCKVMHPTRGIIKPDLRKYQMNMLDTIENNQKSVVCVGRQVGKSTICSLYALWYAMFTEEPVNIFILANKAKSAQGLLDDIKVAYEELPAYLKKGINEYNKTAIEFENKSKINTSATTKDSIRGESVSFLLLDEFAHVPPHIAEEFYQAAQPTISCVAGDTLILTDNGFERIDKYSPKDSQIGDYITMDNINVYGQKGMEEISYFYNSPKSKTNILISKYGFEIECTEDHPLKINDDDQFSMKKSNDIIKGDQIILYVGMNKYGNENNKSFKIEYSEKHERKKHRKTIKGIDDIFAYMIGGYLAEDWTERDDRPYIFIFNTEKEIQSIFLEHGFKYCGNNENRLYANQKEYYKFEYVFDDIWNKKSYEKEIPAIILKSSKKTQKQVISGIIDGLGNVSKNGEITLVSSSRKMLQQIQLMLLNMGIVSSLEHKKINDKQMFQQEEDLKSFNDKSKLKILSDYSTIILNEFDLKLNRKKERLFGIYKKEQNLEKQKKIIFTNWMLESIDVLMNMKLISDNELKKKHKISREKWQKGTSINVETFRRFISYVEEKLENETEDFLKLKELISEDCFYDEIISIEKSENRTYDLTCPKTHTFLQNGILGSNTGGKICIISTPNGNNGVFYDIFSGGLREENGYKAFSIDWREVPRYGAKNKRIDSEKFKEETIKATSLQSWMQEHECSFLGSAKTLINSTTLKKIGITTKESVIRHRYEYWDCWEKPKENHIYVIGIDVAKGTERDYSVMQIIDITNANLAKQVATYANNTIDPFDFTDKVFEMATLYNNAFVIIENNTYGHEVCRKLYEDLQYENIYKEYRTKKLGITSSTRTKRLGTSILKKISEDHKLIYKDPKTYKELCDFIEVRPDIYSCPEGKQNHDDRVMALVWATYFLRSDFWREWEEYVRQDVIGQEQNINNDNNKEKELFQPILFDGIINNDQMTEFGDELLW